MAIHRYSIEQLLHLRNSPLVQKPDNLPAIEQWIEYVYLDIGGTREKLRIPHSESQQQQRSRPQPREAGTASPMGNFSAGQRPGLVGSRMTSKDDVSLGPPRTVFASSRTTPRLADFADTTQSGETSEANDRLQSRQSQARKGIQSSEAEGKYFRESWTSARERRTATNEEDASLDKGGRYGRRDRDREQEGDRRNGLGERQDTRWSLRDEKKPNGERDRRWRSRERPRQDRDWERPGHTDREPEWMEDVGGAGSDDMGGVSAMPKNQEDFEKWKQAQHARDKKPTQEEVTPAPEPVAEPSIPVAEPAPANKPPTALQLDSLTNTPLYDWGKQGGNDAVLAPSMNKPTGGKGKASRFMPMFKKDEPKEEMPHPVTHVQKLSADLANASTEDKEGFQRILQMLGGSNLGPLSSTIPVEPTSPPSKVSGGTRSKSRFTGFFDQGPKSPDAAHVPEVASQEQLFRGHDDEKAPDAHKGDKFPVDTSKPEAFPARGLPFGLEQTPSSNANRESRPQTARALDVSQEQPQRSEASPDVNIHNLLASQRTQRAQGPDKNSEFLLNLLQTKGGSRPPSQQARPDGNFPLWLDQTPHSTEPLAPKPRMPPAPGLFEEQLLRNAQNNVIGNDDAQQRRIPQQRPPPGFFDEQTLLMQQQQQYQQRRNMAEPPPPQRMLQQQQQQQQMRRTNDMPQLPRMPQMQLPPFGPGGAIPPEFLQSPPPGYPQAPPPGFAAHAPRHAPGFHSMPGVFQQREPSSLGLNMGPPPNIPPGFFGGPLQQNMPLGGFMPLRPTNENGNGGVAAGNSRGDFGAGGPGRGR